MDERSWVPSDLSKFYEPKVVKSWEWNFYVIFKEKRDKINLGNSLPFLLLPLYCNTKEWLLFSYPLKEFQEKSSIILCNCLHKPHFIGNNTGQIWEQTRLVVVVGTTTKSS